MRRFSRRCSHRARMALALGCLAALTPAAPGAAGTPADPEVRDACFAVPSAAPREELQPLWQDICAAWVETPVVPADGPRALSLTVEFAGEIRSRPPTTYEISWRTGPCHYLLHHSSQEADGGVVAGTHREVHVHCGSFLPQQCGPAALMPCGTWAYSRRFPIPDHRFREEGARFTATIVTEGELSERRADFAPGSVIADLHVRAYPQLLGMGETCAVGTCVRSFDVAGPGRSYTIEPPQAGQPPIAVCEGREPREASANAPHLGDARDDHLFASAEGPVEPTAEATDVVALWVGVLAGSPLPEPVFTLNLLPAGPAPRAEEVTYYIQYDRRRFVRAEGHEDGAYHFDHGLQQNGQWATLGPADGWVDPVSGHVEIVLPRSGTPSPDEEPRTMELTGGLAEYRFPGDSAHLPAEPHVHRRLHVDRTDAAPCTVALR